MIWRASVKRRPLDVKIAQLLYMLYAGHANKLDYNVIQLIFWLIISGINHLYL